MSAAPAEHAAHPEPVKGAPAGEPSKGTYKHGTFLGVLEQFKGNLGDIIKVIPDVYAERNPSHPPKTGGDHPPKTGGDHPPKKVGETAGGDHPAEKKAEKAEADLAAYKRKEKLGALGRLVGTLPDAWKAWRAGTLQTGHITAVLDPIADATDNEWARFFLEPMVEGGKMLLNWGLGAHDNLEDMNPAFETIGTQIHKFSQDKAGSYRHSCESFVAGLKGDKDISLLNLHFSRFHDKTAFDEALKGGKATLRKNLASLLGVDATLKEPQVKSLISSLIERLGGRGQVKGTPPNTTLSVVPNPPLRATLQTQHVALLKLYENAFNWLDAAALKQVFDETVPKGPVKIDFETFGDHILEGPYPVERDFYLRGIDEKPFKQTFDIKFDDLISPVALNNAIKNPSRRGKVKSQLRRFAGTEDFTPTDLSELTDRIKALRERITGEPPIPVEPALQAKLNAFLESLKSVEDAFTATPDILETLFGDEKVSTPIAYDKLGMEIEVRAKADLKGFEKQLVEPQIYMPYGPLLSEENLLIESEKNPENLKTLLGQFFGISGALTYKKIEDQAKKLNGLLVAPPTAAHPKANLLAAVLISVKDDVLKLNLLTPRLNCADIGADIMGRIRTRDDLEALDGAMLTREWEVELRSLFDTDTLAEEIEQDSAGVQAKIKNLFGIKGPVTRAAVKKQSLALVSLLSLPSRAGAPRNELDNVDRLYANILAVTSFLTDASSTIPTKTLNKLYGVKEAPAPETVKIDYAHFADQVLAMPENDPKEQERFLRGFIKDNFSTEFGALLRPSRHLSSVAGRELLKKQAIALFNLKVPFDDQDVFNQGKALCERLGSGGGEDEKYNEFVKLLGQAEANLSNFLDVIFADVTPFTVDNFVGNFRTLGDSAQTAAAIRGYDTDLFKAAMNYLVNPDDLDEAIKDLEGPKGIEALRQIRFFTGNPGLVSRPLLLRVLNTFGEKANTVELSTLDREGRTRYHAIFADRDLIWKNLTEPRLKALFEPTPSVKETPRVINYREFANDIFAINPSPADQERFLRGFDPIAFQGAFSALYPVAEMANRVKTPQGKADMREQIARLFYQTGVAPTKVDSIGLGRQGVLMDKKLGGRRVLPTEYDVLSSIMSEIMMNLKLDEIYADEPEIIEVQPERLGNILKTELGNKEGAISFLRGYNPGKLREYFSILADGNAFDTFIQTAKPADRARLQEKLRAFTGLDMGLITVETMAKLKIDFKARLDLAEPASLPVALKEKYEGMETLVKNVVETLSGEAGQKRLDRLFNGKSVMDVANDVGKRIKELF